MEVTDKQFEDLIDIMDLGMSLRQNQLNGSDSRSGREVLKEYLDELPDTPNLKYVGIIGSAGGNIEAMHRVIEMAQAHDMPILAMPDFAERGNIAMDEPLPLMITRHDLLDDFPIIDINDDAKQGTNPNGRKAGNSKKRRKR